MCIGHTFTKCIALEYFTCVSQALLETIVILYPGLVTPYFEVRCSSFASAATTIAFLGTGLSHPYKMSEEIVSVLPLMYWLFFQ